MSDLRDYLLALHRKHGVLTPELVVDDNRPEDAPYHDSFEWDDAQAGEAYRIEQARSLIRTARIVERPAKGRKPASYVRAFHAMPDPDSAGKVYVPTEDIAQDPFQREMLVREMEREWKAFKARYEHLVEFLVLIRDDVAA